ncbi:aspartate aminotransferase family protein [bacterium]|nr:aspartate aminotransferase family protein [bacterium]
MSPDVFREQGKAVIEMIARYMETVETYPVMSAVRPGEIRAALPDHAPVTGESFDAILADIAPIIMPGITHWQSPNWFAYFSANTSGPSILGELLSAGLGVQGMLWQTSPACTELETHVLDWLVEMLDLPRHFLSSGRGGGVIQDSASSATLCALLAAREQATSMASNRDGLRGGLIAYASSQAHSSVEKAVKVAGIGSAQLRTIDTDDAFAMDPDNLARTIRRDRDRGLTPFFVSATVGTTSSNAIDPLERIGEICRREKLWLHVDAAMSGTAALCPEFRYIHKGLESADSYCFNPHKWMFTNFDCDCFYVADRAALINSLSLLPEYLRNRATESGAVIDYRDWHVPLGRRFRALKLWFVIRYYGIAGLQYHVRRHVELTRMLVRMIEADGRFVIAAPVPLNLVCFYHKAGDAFTRELMERVNSTGKVYMTHTKLGDRFVMRICVAQSMTEERHVLGAWELIRRTAGEMESP